jgi:hypothetical protein
MRNSVRLFAELWNLYLGLLTLLGNFILVIVGLFLCGYATYQQLQPLHDVVVDVTALIVGILLIGFSVVRRMVWSFCGLAGIWVGLLWVGMNFFMNSHEKMEFTPEIIAIAAIPPFFMMLYLESTRKRTSDLEISLSGKPENDD